MRRKLLAFAGVLLLASQAWAPPPPRPPARPPAPPVRPPTTPVRPPVRPPVHTTPPNFGASMDAARRHSAAAAADLLRRQSAASVSRAQRAAHLNAIALQMLRQQQAASLAELRRLRADWVAVGPGAGLDPIVAMQLEAAESAAERLLLAEILQLIRDGQFACADAKIGALESPRYLPAAVVHALPGLRAELKKVPVFAAVQAALKTPHWLEFEPTLAPLVALPRDALPPALVRAADAWGALGRMYNVVRADSGIWGHHTVAQIEQALKAAGDAAGPELARKLRAELAAKLLLDGRADDAVKLLDGEVDPVHAAAVLADIQAAMLGRGEFTTPQIAEFVDEAQRSAPRPAVAVFPPDKLANWKTPARKPGFPTIIVAASGARKQFKALVDAEAGAGAAKITAAADRIRAALAAEAAPLKGFVEKVEAARGQPFASPAERQLAAVASTRRLTVAEAVGVLAVDADRPASAARLLATVPALTNPGAFAAAVEVAGRAPAGFAAHPDAEFKVAATRDRARVREAFAAVLNAHAGKVVSGREPPEVGHEAVAADVQNRLGLAPGDALAPAECVQALLDVCRDWADEHARLANAMRELNEAIAGAEAGVRPGERDPPRDPDDVSADAERKERVTAAQVRRLSVQADKRRREAGIALGCRLLGGYGPLGAPALDWLGAQADGGDTPWRADAAVARGRVGGG